MAKKNHQILYIEDDLTIGSLIQEILGPECVITIASTIREAKKLLDVRSYDLFLLDITLSDGNGLKFFSSFRHHDKLKHTPVVFLTGGSDLSDLEIAFSLGADDFIHKPFNSREFRARIYAKLEGRSKKPTEVTAINVGRLQILPASFRVLLTGDGDPTSIDVTPTEFKLLHLLASHQDEVLARNQIIQSVWPDDPSIMDRTVDTHLSNLRKKLKDSDVFITAVQGRGYRIDVRASGQRGSQVA